MEEAALTGKEYSLSVVCAAVGVARSSYYEYQRKLRGEKRAQQKRGPKVQAEDARLLELIRAVLERSPFHTEGTNEGPCSTACLAPGAGQPGAGQPADAGGWIALAAAGEGGSPPEAS